MGAAPRSSRSAADVREEEAGLAVREEATGVDVEPRVADPQSEHSATDLIRSMALSSAELWHDVLQRLAEVQESQVILARAVAEIGATVKSLSAALPALNGGPTPALAVAPAQPAMHSGPAPAAEASSPDGTPLGVTDDEIPLAGFDGQDDLVGPLPADVVAAFFPPETEVLPWYRRRVSLRLRRRRRNVASSTLEAEWPPLPSPLEQLLPPPPPLHLLDEYAMTAASTAAPAGSTAQVPDPVTAVDTGSDAQGEPVPHDVFVAPAEPVLEPTGELPPLTPRPLVYTPSNAETALAIGADAPFALDEPVAAAEPAPAAGEPLNPVAVPFELDPPQGFGVQSAAATPLIVPERAAVIAPSPPPTEAESTETPEAVLVGVLGGRPVVDAQMSVSMATEILGSAAAAAPSVPAPSHGEPARLVISEDLTIVSKNHRKRRQFRLR